jgi:hypothetical protein
MWDAGGTCRVTPKVTRGVRRRPSPWMLRRTDSRSTEEPIMTSDSGRDMPSSPGPKLVPAVDHFEPPASLTPSSLGTIIQGFKGINRIIETASRADKALTLVKVKLLRSRAGEWAVQELRERFPDLLEELDRLDEDLQKNPLKPALPLPDAVPVETPSIIFRGRERSSHASVPATASTRATGTVDG